MIDFSEALLLIQKQAYSFGTEKITLDNALNRVLAEDIFADRDYPPFNRAAMDGFAIRYQDFEDGIFNFKMVSVIYAGESTTVELQKGECFKIMTGAAVPLSANMVVRVEDSNLETNLTVKLIVEKAKKHQNISKQGEDAKRGDLIITKGIEINASIWATLAVLGKAEIEVQKLPNVAIISTGNEIKQVFEPVNSVQIRDSNTYTIQAMLQKFQIKTIEKYKVQDNQNQIEETLKKALKNDIIIISGGVSAGDADFIPESLQKLGVKKIFHKVKIKPGKPLWFGVTENKTIVFALPGNPFSVQVACKIFLEPFLNACFHIKNAQTEKHIYIGKDRIKTNSLDEFLPCIFNYELSSLELSAFNGSGDISATLKTDGLLHHSKDFGDLKSNNKAIFYRW